MEYICCPGRSHHDPRLYSDTEALATRSHVLTTTGLYNDYTFHSVLSLKKFETDHQTVFPCERVGSGHKTRSDPIYYTQGRGSTLVAGAVSQFGGLLYLH